MQQKTDLTSYQVTVYSAYEPGPYFVEGQVAYAYNTVDMSRRIIGGDKAVGKTQAHQYSATLAAGVPFSPQDNLTVTPKAGLFYSYSQMDPYREKEGGLWSMHVTPDDAEILEGEFGGVCGL